MGIVDVGRVGVDVQEELDVAGPSGAVEDTLQDLLLPGRALAARRTLAAGFACEEAHHAQACLHGIGRLVHHDQPARAHHGADAEQRVVVDFDVEVLFHYSRTYRGQGERVERTRARHLAFLACGLDGVRIVIDDYVRPQGWRVLTKAVLYLFSFIIIVLGSYVVFTFTP